MSLQQFPLNIGTLPESDRQVNDPRLREGFVNKEGHVQLLPNLTLNRSFTNLRAVFKSKFNDRTIVVDNKDVIYIEYGITNKVGEIIETANAVRIDENVQGQVVIVNGSGAWVFDQPTDGFFKLNADNNGFDLINPVDVVELNTFIIIVSGDDNKWIVSLANNALQYAGNEVVVTDNSLGKLTGCEHWNNNLFIFGENGVQRWIPSIERTTFDFPFSQDPTYRDEYGCVQTGSLLSENNRLFYLSENGQIRLLSPSGIEIITNDGIELILSSYDASQARASYFYFDGYYFYIISFLNDDNSFVYCPLTKKWSETSQLWVDFSGKGGTKGLVALKDGLYELTTDMSSGKNVVIKTQFVYPKSPQLEYRAILATVILESTQGKGETQERELCWLSLSKDNILFGNEVGIDFSKTAERLFQIRWHLTYSNTGFVLKFRFRLFTNLTIMRGYVRFA